MKTRKPGKATIEKRLNRKQSEGAQPSVTPKRQPTNARKSFLINAANRRRSGMS